MTTIAHDAPAASVSGRDWDRFFARVQDAVMQHPVVTDNAYCTWFAGGTASRDQVRDLVQQFSVCSQLFIVAQLLKTINAPTLQQQRESREILANELGVVFRSGRTSPTATRPADEDETERLGDPELVSTEGTVDGG